MTSSDPSLLYITLVLPALFSLTLILEGIHKFLEHQHGWIPLMMGCIFLIATVSGFYFLQ